MTYLSSIRDNREKRGTAGDFLHEHITAEARLYFVSAYFTIYAYEQLKEKLEAAAELNFLFGEPSFLRAVDPGKTTGKDFKIADDDLKLAGPLRQKSVAAACASWMARDSVQIRSFIRPDFLHGKLYYIEKSTGDREALTGSSNFTVAGLGLSGRPNIELNMIVNDRRDLLDLREWFREVWDDLRDEKNLDGLVEDVKARVLSYLARLHKDNDPEFIYFKTLFHLFERQVRDQEATSVLETQIGFRDTKIWQALHDFQREGVTGALKKIDQHNGCILADSVGLGKTFEALAVIKFCELRNLRVLVLCPKKLRDNWDVYRLNDTRNPFLDDNFRYDVLSHTDLGRTSGKAGDINLSTFNWSNYDLVVIDESHNFRNNNPGRRDPVTRQLVRYSRYQRLLENVLQRGTKTKVLLLSATPVNNNLRDLRNQLFLITRGDDAGLANSAGIVSLNTTIKQAQAQFTTWADPKNKTRVVKNLLDKLDASFFTLLDELTIARSRRHIEQYYDLSRIGKFPTRLKPVSLSTDIDLAGTFPTYDELNADMVQYKLAQFTPSEYVPDELRAKYGIKPRKEKAQLGFDQAGRENALVGVMKVNFLKRLESSICSFQLTLERTIKRIEALEKQIFAYEQKPAATTTITTEPLEEGFGEMEDEELDEETAADLADLVGKRAYYLGDLDLEGWKKDLAQDRQQLQKLHSTAREVSAERDAKLARLKEMIADKLAHPVNDSNRKVLVFTAFADTADYLYNNLHEWADTLGLKTGLVTGGGYNKTTYQPAGFGPQTEFNTLLTHFSPLSKRRAQMPSLPQVEEIDLLIATDCISEGQNLQDCDYLVNYDIHWNPVRIIQRYGRIDRLGSRNEAIQLVNFWPTDDLNHYIKLKDRIESRMALVDLTATGEDNVLDQKQLQELVEGDLHYRQQQLLRMRDEVLDADDPQDGQVSLTQFTLEDFRAELLQFLNSRREELAAAPLGLYAVVPAPSTNPDLKQYAALSPAQRQAIGPGVVFCLRHKGGGALDGSSTAVLNPTEPYCLLYVRQNGEVRYNFLQARHVLDLLRATCHGREVPYEALCEAFEQETKHGEDMSTYSALLKAATSALRRELNKRVSRAVADGELLEKRPQRPAPTASAEAFELITWLVIR
jgi:SNF2 family DNA or RNA helicase